MATSPTNIEVWIKSYKTSGSPLRHVQSPGGGCFGTVSGHGVGCRGYGEKCYSGLRDYGLLWSSGNVQKQKKN